MAITQTFERSRDKMRNAEKDNETLPNNFDFKFGASFIVWLQ